MSTMNAVPERVKRAIQNFEKAGKVPEPAGAFFQPKCPAQVCFGSRMTLVVTNKDGASNIFCTGETTLYRTGSSFYAINLFWDDKFCLGLEDNRTVIYQVYGWSYVKTLDESRAWEGWRAAGKHIFYVNRGAGVVEVWDKKGTKIQARLEHDELDDILVHPREPHLLSWSSIRTAKAWNLESPKKPKCQTPFNLPDDCVPVMVLGNLVVLRSEATRDCEFLYFDGSPVGWIKNQWTKFCSQFGDGTNVIGSSSDANERTVRNFTIIGPDGTRKSTFEHEDACSVAILADTFVVTSTVIGVKKIWSKDGNYIAETRRGSICPALFADADGKLWEISSFGNEIMAIHVWDFMGDTPQIGDTLVEFIKRSR